MMPAVGEDGILNLVLSQAQLRVIQHAVSPKTTCIAVGSIRSGKSFATMIGAAIWLLSQETRCDCALIAQSVESGWRNLARDLADFINSVDGCSCELDRGLGFRLIIKGKSEVNLWLFGGADVKSRKRIQGATLRGLIVEEGAILPREFVYQAMGRLSEDNSKVFMTANPDGGEQHFFKAEIIDASKPDDTELVLFSMADNPSLSDAVKDRLKSSFAANSVYYRRYILGEWIKSTGVIFGEYTVTEENEIEGGRWSVAMDWGPATTLALIAVHARGRHAIIGHELVHNARKEGIINEQQAVEKIIKWFEEISAIKNTTLLCDPHTCASTKILLRDAGFKVRNANNALKPGIVCTQKRLANGEVKINARCKRTLSALNNYLFDERASDRGEDKPAKSDHSHLPDCVRYHCYSMGARLARAMTLREALG